MSTVPTCPDFDALRHFSLGAVRESEAAPLESHLATCPLCVATLHGIKEEDTLLDAMRAQPALKSRPEIDATVQRLMGVLKDMDPTFPRHGADALLRKDGEAIDFLAPPERPDEIGRLGTYRILKVLGAGGMGIVFEAEDTLLRRAVALKVLRPLLASSESARKRFLREARAAAKITNDHVVTIFQVGEEQGLPFLAMQYLAGETLEARLRRDGPLPLTEILRIGRELADGLSAAHSQGLLHRDIKPANIWLEAEGSRQQLAGSEPTGGRAKILDFGLAWAADDDSSLTAHGTVIGTPSYMAPEQARGEPADVRSDLFSLGSVMYAMSTGQPPFHAESNFATFEKVRTEKPRPIQEINPAIPQWLDDVVAKLHAKNPPERFQSAAQVATALHAATHRIQEPSVSRPRAIRAPRWWAAAALLFLPILGLTLCEATGTTQLHNIVVGRRGDPNDSKQGELPGDPTPPRNEDPPKPVEPGPLQKGPTVYPAAIFTFEERGNRVAGYGAKVADILFANLADREELYLVDRTNLHKILGELELNISGVVKSSEANKVGQLTGAKLFISGSVIEADKKIYLIAKIVGTESSRTLGVSVDGVMTDELGPLVEKLAHKVAEKISKEADKVVSKAVAQKDRFDALKQTLKKVKGARPTVAIEVNERHIGVAAIDSSTQTEFAKYCKEAGFIVIDTEVASSGKPDVVIKGEAFTETLARNGNLISVKARIELKVIDRKTGEVLAVDRQTAIFVDLAEMSAGKAALEEAAAILAERMLPKLVKE